jgi:hypothetical protein
VDGRSVLQGLSRQGFQLEQILLLDGLPGCTRQAFAVGEALAFDSFGKLIRFTSRRIRRFRQFAHKLEEALALTDE